MKIRLFLLSLTVLLLSAVGCRREVKIIKQYDRQLPPGQFALRKITDPAMIPNIKFACYELYRLRDSIDRSLSYLSKPSSQRFFPCDDITHAQAVASLKSLGELLDQGLIGRKLEQAVRDRFDFYQSVGCDDMGTVLFTGYYTPIFDGSLKQTDKFKYPLYKQPDDLVKGQDGQILGRKLADGQVVPYPARREIEESRMLAGKELIWLADPFEVYIAQVQGSAKIRLPDSSLVTVGYAANNGHEYKSIGQEMIRDNIMAGQGLSLKAMIDYFKANPGKVNQYVYRNPRFVFFQTDQGDPRGSLNEPVTELRTIATDKSIYPRACIAFMTTKLPRLTAGQQVEKRPYMGFSLDQDTGGAIRAPGRCDVYLGTGDLAGRMAGQVYEEGKLYYLFLKPELMQKSSDQSPASAVPDAI